MSTLETRLLRRVLKLIAAKARLAAIEKMQQTLEAERFNILRRIAAEKAAIPTLVERTWRRLAKKMKQLPPKVFVQRARHLIAPEIPQDTQAARRVLNHLRRYSVRL